ncbi:ATP-dependent protease ATPase subunit HslU [Ignavibacteria bacterium]|nr:ATP-dependent protease ATPase subunit HslU [Bacteroidota bacterium]MCZ2132170.1 ATP-dependent protease ATPase subunit HslU [Bacteroidota bacterium]
MAKKSRKSSVKPVVSAEQYLTPKQIVIELDAYIIGQHKAKRAVAIALRNRWRRQQIDESLRDEIMPNNIILIGPTGVGKTEIARRLAKLAGAPFVKVEATKFTEVGYVGRDVESMIRDLAEASVVITRSEREAAVREASIAAAHERLTDMLTPQRRASMGSFDDGDDQETYAEVRERISKELLSGTLDETLIELDAEVETLPQMHVLGPIGLDDMGINIQDMLGGILPKRSKKRKMTIAEARRYFEEEETDKLIDMESVTAEALHRAEQSGIVFIDEIDKIAAKTGGAGPDVSREGVQRDLLPVVEGSAVNTKYGVLRTDHVLFIASGAFHVSKPSDLIPELQGRFPIRADLDSLTEADLRQILTAPRNALVRQYEAIMAADGVKLSFTAEAIGEIAAIAARVNEEVANIGARRLHAIMTTLLDDLLFDAPYKAEKVTEVKITVADVRARLEDLSRNTDLSRFVL